MRVPSSTYRVQLNADFPLQRAAELVPYLDALGVDDLYVSPLLQSRRGSNHGYDVTDATRIDPDRGGDEGIGALHEALAEHQMGLLVDIVPNHMAAHPENPWWHDVLRHGPRSRYARHFDIDWTSSDPVLVGRVLVPFVDGDPQRLLREGRIVPTVADDALVLDVAGFRLPLDPTSTIPLLDAAYDALDRDEATEAAALVRAARDAAAAVPRRDDPAAAETRRLRTETFDERLAVALADEAVAAACRRVSSELDPALLEVLLDEQAYVLDDWRNAPQRVNYRRFFDVNDLVCLRIEDPAVFHDSHRRLRALASSGLITGLRVDHIDGLADPQEYLERLQETFCDAAPGAAADGTAGGFYTLVEKILVGPERLPTEWPMHGATGYESAALIEGLFVDARGLESIDAVYSAFIGTRRDYTEVVHEAKQQVIRELFPGLFRDLARRLHGLRRACGAEEISPQRLQAALEATAAAFPVYRTYCRPQACSTRDHRLAQDAVQTALRREPDLADALDAVRAVLLHEPPFVPNETTCDWMRRWQQTTGPVMAKGYEDTALYRYFSLVSLNEVGDRPDQTIWLENFHQEMADRLRRTPHGLNAGTTHDSKRSEDVRARLNALSELPQEWAERIQQWQAENATHKAQQDGRPRPGPDMEYLLYETLVGAWPLDPREHERFPDRVVAYMQKAAREAKRATHWLHPDETYEAQLESFIRTLLNDDAAAPFRASLQEFVERIAPLGMINSLAQTTLRCTTPGIPDTYQGQELWDFSLVDPDNRRPVDFARRREILASLKEASSSDRMALVRDLLDTWPDGRIKAYVLSRLLPLRKEHPALFAHGEYIPLRTEGQWGRHVVAFARHLDGDWVLVAVPRSSEVVAQGQLPVGSVWGDTHLRLPAGAPQVWEDVLTGARIDVSGNGIPVLALAELWQDLPLTVLRIPRSEP